MLGCGVRRIKDEERDDVEIVRYRSREAAECESPARKCRENLAIDKSPVRDGTRPRHLKLG